MRLLSYRNLVISTSSLARSLSFSRRTSLEYDRCQRLAVHVSHTFQPRAVLCSGIQATSQQPQAAAAAAAGADRPPPQMMLLIDWDNVGRTFVPSSMGGPPGWETGVGVIHVVTINLVHTPLLGDKRVATDGKHSAVCC